MGARVSDLLSDKRAVVVCVVSSDDDERVDAGLGEKLDKGSPGLCFSFFFGL